MPLSESTSLYYELEGDPANPVVVLSNSLGADLSMWDPQLPALLPHFRVLRYDTRGHGRSPLPAGETTLDTLGQDVLNLLDHLNLSCVHLCGVSLGGLTAMWVALHAGHRLHSVTLSNTAAKIGTAAGWKERIATVEAAGLASLADVLPTRWFSPAFLADPTRLEPQRRMLLRCSAAGYTAASAAIRDADLRDQVAAIRTPTLILSGSEDAVTPPSDGLALQASIPGSRFLQVPGAHLANIEYPGPYNQALLPFLLHHTPSQGPQNG